MLLYKIFYKQLILRKGYVTLRIAYVFVQSTTTRYLQNEVNFGTPLLITLES